MRHGQASRLERLVDGMTTLPRAAAVAWPVALRRADRIIRSLHRRAVGAASCLEGELLGVDRASAAATLAEAGWIADAPGTWCAACGATLARRLAGEGAGAASEGRALLQSLGGCPRCMVREGTEQVAPWRQPRLGDGVIRLGRYAEPLATWILAIKHGAWSDMALELGHHLGRAALQLGREPGVPWIVVPVPTPALRRLERGIDHARWIAEGVAAELDAPVVELLRRASGPTQAARSAAARRRGLGFRLAPEMALRRRVRSPDGEPILRQALVAAVWMGALRRWDLARSRGSRRRLLAHLGDLVEAGASIALHPRRRWGRAGLHGHRVILVDDVRTTGSTLMACCRVLRRLRPARVEVAVLAAAD